MSTFSQLTEPIKIWYRVKWHQYQKIDAHKTTQIALKVKGEGQMLQTLTTSMGEHNIYAHQVT